MADTSRTKVDTKMDLAWLVSKRNAIQKLALEIYDFDRAIPNRLRITIFPVQGFLVGIAFSLWRAVFLSLPVKDATAMHEHGRQILRIVIETNAVGFPQDKATQEWMAGYYNNNAIIRLVYAFSRS